MYFNNGNNGNPMTRNGINWVQGIESAKAFQLYPNSNIVLMDSENEGIFYIKTCDNIGMCNLRTFKYEELSNFGKNQENNVDLSQYVTRDELNEMLGEIKNEQSISRTKQAAINTGYKLSGNTYSTSLDGNKK